jgi:hypothetical protein
MRRSFLSRKPRCPGKKTTLLSRSPHPRIPREDDRKNTWGGPAQPHRTDGGQRSEERPAPGDYGADVRHLVDQRLPTDRRAHQARAAIRPAAPANTKQVYRLMKKSGLLLHRHTTGRRTPRAHDGTIATTRSNNPLVFGRAGVDLPEWRYRSRRLTWTATTGSAGSQQRPGSLA